MTLDDRARQAASALHEEVAASTDTEAALARVLSADGEGRRRPWLPAVAAAVAVLALVAGALAIAGDDEREEEPVAVDMEPDVVEGTPLRLASPTEAVDTPFLPVTGEPTSGLADGDIVHVVATGFLPGDSVGIVQCSFEAPWLANRDGCMILNYTQSTADADGVVTGDYQVHRYMTTPYNGTVDCAASPERCRIGVGTVSVSDRRGGFPITFAPAEATLELPMVEVTPTTGLADQQVVHVSATGLVGFGATVEVCSLSPAVCWLTGDRSAADESSLMDVSGIGPDFYAGTVRIQSDGTFEGDVPVWRFLPGDEPGSYVDCAVSECVLRLVGDRAPAPVPLAFSGDEPAPVGPFVEISPAEGLAPGFVATIRGSGFDSSAVYVNLCATQPAPAAGEGSYTFCNDLNAGEPVESDRGHPVEVVDGSFTFTTVLPGFDGTLVCSDETTCTTVAIDATWTFTIEVYADGRDEGDGQPFPPPTFAAPALPVGFTP